MKWLVETPDSFNETLVEAYPIFVMQLLLAKHAVSLYSTIIRTVLRFIVSLTLFRSLIREESWCVSTCIFQCSKDVLWLLTDICDFWITVWFGGQTVRFWSFSRWYASTKVDLLRDHCDLIHLVIKMQDVTGEILGSNEFFEPRVSPSSALAVKRQVQRGLPRDTLPNESPRMRAHEDQLFHSTRPGSSFSSLLGRDSRSSGSSQTLSRTADERGHGHSRSIVGQFKSAIRKESSMGSITMVGSPPNNVSHTGTTVKTPATSVSEALGSAMGPFQQQLSLFSSTYSQVRFFQLSLARLC